MRSRITTGNGSKLMSAPSQEALLEHEPIAHPLQLVERCLVVNNSTRGTTASRHTWALVSRIRYNGEDVSTTTTTVSALVSGGGPL